MSAACDFTRACPRYVLAMGKPHRSGPAFEITKASPNYGRIALILGVLFVLIQFARVAFAMPAYLAGGQ